MPPSLPARAQTTHAAARRGGAAGGAAAAGAGTTTGSPQSRVILGQTSVIQFSPPLGPTPTSPSPAAVATDPHAARRTDALALASRVHLTAVTFLDM